MIVSRSVVRSRRLQLEYNAAMSVQSENFILATIYVLWDNYKEYDMVAKHVLDQIIFWLQKKVLVL